MVCKECEDDKFHPENVYYERWQRTKDELTKLREEVAAHKELQLLQKAIKDRNDKIKELQVKQRDYDKIKKKLNRVEQMLKK